MSHWGNTSAPTLLVPEELKNHQVIKGEVRHFVSPSIQRPKYKRVTSLPNICCNRGESRWQSSSSDSPSFRGVHSPSSVRRTLQIQQSSTNKTNKKKSSSHKKGQKFSSISAHERLTGGDRGEVKRRSHSNKTKKRHDSLHSKSAHDTLRTRGLSLDDREASSDHRRGGKTTPLHHDWEKCRIDVHSSGLFEGDSFIGTMPLGGNQGEQSVLTSSGSVGSLDLDSLGASCLELRSGDKQQPRKSAMRKKRSNASGVGSDVMKDSTDASLSSISAVPQEDPSESLSATIPMESSGSTMASQLEPSASLMKTEDRWASSFTSKHQNSPIDSPKRPGRAASASSFSLTTAFVPPFVDEEDDDENKNMKAQSRDGHEISTRSAPGVAIEFVNDSANGQDTTAPKAARELIPNGDPQPTPSNEQRDEEVISGVMALKTEDTAISTQTKPRRRGSTGALAQKWEEHFSSHTPILPLSAPSTPRDGARKRFNHRRRGSFGIFSNISFDKDDDTNQNHMLPVTNRNDDDLYEMFLLSGATCDFAAWSEQQRKVDCATPTISPGTQRRTFRPPTKRRGSTGALAQKWEHELLPSLQSTSAHSQTTNVSPRRGSGSVQEKQRLLEEWAKREKSPNSTNVDLQPMNGNESDGKLGTPRRESRRRGSMGALVEKWEKLVTPSSSPKERIEKIKVSLVPVDKKSGDPSEDTFRAKGHDSNIGFDIPAGQRSIVKHPPTNPLYYRNFGSVSVKDEEPVQLPVVAKKQKRRGSTGILGSKSKDDEGGKTSSPVSGKRYIRRVSLGHLATLEKEKKKKSHREKSSLKSSKKKKAIKEAQLENLPLQLLQSTNSQQSPGEASIEEAARTSPIPVSTSEDAVNLSHGKKTPNGISKRSSSVPGKKKIKRKAILNDMDLSKRSTDSLSTNTAATVTSDIDVSKRSACSCSARVGRTKTEKEELTCSASAHCKQTNAITSSRDDSRTGVTKSKVKTRSNSVGVLKVKVKKSSSDTHRSRSEGLLISPVDSAKIEAKKRSKSPGRLRAVQQNVQIAV